MQLALTVNPWIDEQLMFAQQFGADCVLAEMPSDAAWELTPLARLRHRVERAGLRLAGLAGLPGDPAAAQAGLVAAAQARFDLICWQGAAPSPSVLADLLDAAEGANIRLAVPITLGALSGPLPASAAHVHDLHWPSDRLATTGPAEAIAPELLNRVAMVTVGPLRSEPPAAAPARRNEIVVGLQALRQVGYVGLVRLGPQPTLHNDSAWGHTAQAHALGYLRAVLTASEREQ